MTKIISKTLTARLNKVIGLLVTSDQTDFVSGRSILDGPLVVNEMITSAFFIIKKMFLFKVDFDKAFDSLSWSFLDDILRQMGFGVTWRTWIRSLL